ncbi:putative purple acid phosphatase 20 [Forsythia ovata]|uniref:Purple acid phosphatase 20 n=1 Tax=Forsythia ovata TaxID=205694 RepID=A0ABD1SQM6_9LAMI
MAVNNWVMILALALAFAGAVDFGFSYDRPPRRKSLSKPFLKDLYEHDSTSPQQVHISLSGNNKMRISWITSDPTPAIVKYGSSPGDYKFSANGTTKMYQYLEYNSGEIHDVVIGPLHPDTVYYYICGTNYSPEFTFKTPPPRFPIKFAISGTNK